MYSSYQLARRYLRYYMKASNGKGHGMHSPFVYDFIRHVLNGKTGETDDIENLRRQLLRDGSEIFVEDFGAGSRLGGGQKRKVADIARRALKPARYAQLLHRLAAHYKPATVLELGTSLGLTTAYLSRAVPQSQLISIEGSKAISALATQNLQRLGCTNVQLLQGSFGDRLPGALAALPSIDLAYVDGNHRYAPTTDYFQQLLPHIHEHSILVFDDIHWSAEMEEAWSFIKSHASVAYTIDIFFLGFCFFRKEFRVPQHFSIRF